MEKPRKSLVDAVHRAYPQLSARERLVADLVLESPGEISAYPASELAQMVGVSNSTVTRFVQKIGFDTYEEARRSAREAREWGSPLFLTSRAGGEGRQAEGLLQRFGEGEAAILATALGGLAPSRLDEITDALASARRLYFMGFRNSHYLAGYTRWQFIQFRKNTHLIPGPGETLAERIADLGPGDMVLVVGVRRIVGKLRRYLQAIHETGADVLLVTDPSARVTPAYARWTITCPVENPYVFDSYTGVMAVLRLLAFCTFEKLGKRGRAHLEAVELHHEKLAEFE